MFCYSVVCSAYVFFFFFKQKTAYEMRISDWSSDVCSSDLPKLGEAVCAWIVRAPGSSLSAADVAAYCKGQLAHFKTPSVIRFVDALPMTPSGKVQTYLMRTTERDGAPVAGAPEMDAIASALAAPTCTSIRPPKAGPLRAFPKSQ